MNLRTSALYLAGSLTMVTPFSASAFEGKYHITAEERTACGMDAVELCSSAYPDEDKLLACMKINRVSLSTGCRPVFEEGIRRRHLN